MADFGAASLGTVGAVVTPPIGYWNGPGGKGGLKPNKRKVGKAGAQHDYAGYSPLDLVVNFVCWAFEQQHFPTPQSIQDRFHCSRATAYRLRRSLARAYGIEPPRLDRMTGTYGPITKARATA